MALASTAAADFGFDPVEGGDALEGLAGMGAGPAAASS
jgi:hypothetical protein